MKYILICVLLIISSTINAKPNKSFNCPVNDWPTSKINTFKANKFIDNTLNIDEFAIEMVDCLADANPNIRDGVAYMAFSNWLRNNNLSENAVLTLYNTLNDDIKHKTNDDKQVYLPFVILAYSEVVRVDRIEPYLTEQQLAQSVNLIADLIKGINDHRGFEDGIGWRHLVAHSADVTLQLILNKRLTAKQHDVLLDALFSQVSPNQHSYTFGESKRIATPVLYSWLGNHATIEQWQQRLDALINPAPFASWQDVYASEAGLHKLHNTRAFLLELYKTVSSNDMERLNLLEPSIQQALNQLR